MTQFETKVAAVWTLVGERVKKNGNRRWCGGRNESPLSTASTHVGNEFICSRLARRHVTPCTLVMLFVSFEPCWVCGQIYINCVRCRGPARTSSWRLRRQVHRVTVPERRTARHDILPGHPRLRWRLMMVMTSENGVPTRQSLVEPSNADS